jgi:hypothetical protein
MGIPYALEEEQPFLTHRVLSIPLGKATSTSYVVSLVKAPMRNALERTQGFFLPRVVAGRRR